MMQPRAKRTLESLRIDRTSRPIDLVHLARQTMGDRGLECEVLRMFDTQVNLYFERLRGATEEYEITLGLHTLKGAARGVGAVALAEQAAAAEIEFRENGQLEEETLDDLGMAVAEVSGYISSILED